MRLLEKAQQYSKGRNAVQPPWSSELEELLQAFLDGKLTHDQLAYALDINVKGGGTIALTTLVRAVRRERMGIPRKDGVYVARTTTKQLKRRSKELRQCAVCPKRFRVYPSIRQKTCSRKCGSVLQGYSLREVYRRDPSLSQRMQKTKRERRAEKFLDTLTHSDEIPLPVVPSM